MDSPIQSTSREIAAERVDRLTEWLETALGARLVAFAVAIPQRDVARIAHAEEEPDPDVERRLRNLFAVTSFFAVRDGAGTAYEWLTEPNPSLEGRSPATLLHEGKAPEDVWFAAASTF